MNENEIINQYKEYEPFFTNFKITNFIGEGSFGKVFEITREDFGLKYCSALKIIHVSVSNAEKQSMRIEGMTERDIQYNLEMIVKSTIKEIELMYKLRGNSHVVQYEDHEVRKSADGLGWDIFIKMELLTSLNRYIQKKHGTITRREIIQLGIDICKVLEACQKYNILHRDIKAENIFVSAEGDFKLGDFGIARVVEKKDMGLSKKGTANYMAPEVYKGQDYDSSVDIYSLGMVMYRLMNNNRPPFYKPYPQMMSLDDRDKALLLRMSGEKFPLPNEVERCRLIEIVNKACAYRPEDRYSSPIFMRQELESILYEEGELSAGEVIRIYDATVIEEEERKERESKNNSDKQSNNLSRQTNTRKEELNKINIVREATIDGKEAPIEYESEKKPNKKSRKKRLKIHKRTVIAGVAVIVCMASILRAWGGNQQDNDTQGLRVTNTPNITATNTPKSTATSVPKLTVTSTPIPMPEIKYSIKDNKVVIKGLTDSSLSTVIIPEKLEGYSVTSIGTDAFRECSNLSSITIPEGVTSIEKSAFYQCSKLKDISFPKSLTSIENWAFCYCSSLSSITIPEGVVSIGSYAFQACENLSSVIISEGVTIISEHAFCYCSSLSSITIPSSVTSIGKDAFKGSDNVTIVTPEGSYAETYAKENNIPYKNN